MRRSRRRSSSSISCPASISTRARSAPCSSVGRTPVHQALQRLQHEGLVEIMPRKGVIVQPDSISRNPQDSRFAHHRRGRARAQRRRACHGHGGRGAERPGARHRSRWAGAGDRQLHRRRPRLSPQIRRARGQPGAERFRPQAARALDPLLVSASVADLRRQGQRPPARRHRRRDHSGRRRRRGGRRAPPHRKPADPPDALAEPHAAAAIARTDEGGAK